MQICGSSSSSSSINSAINNSNITTTVYSNHFNSIQFLFINVLNQQPDGQ